MNGEYVKAKNSRELEHNTEKDRSPNVQSYPLLSLREVLNYDFKLSFNLNLTYGFFSSAIGESRSKTIG